MYWVAHTQSAWKRAPAVARGLGHRRLAAGGKLCGLRRGISICRAKRFDHLVRIGKP
ncbi:hypothetical protein I41_44670 [Lacipirellula limnantheis]|uniref:Uncharacterized protein n=1 Tax=Lacipirellula limnantheis TaxID=2528024 RepID=A0A517U3R2_9BACT|nr:hypothetical protein I41_44670 [Lacipirellula limnantheis]